MGRERERWGERERERERGGEREREGERESRGEWDREMNGNYGETVRCSAYQQKRQQN